MRKPLVTVALIGMALLATPSGWTQTEKAEVDINGFSSDNLGERFVYHVKERVRQSSSLRLTSSSGPRIVVHIATMNNEAVDACSAIKNVSTIYSAVMTYHFADGRNEYYTSYVGYVGSTSLDPAADGIVAAIDKLVESWKKAAASKQ